jgi:hypothetical protein
MGMIVISKWLLMVAGVALILDSACMAFHIPNPLFGWPLPCPLTLLFLGAGIILFAISSKSFKSQ